MHPIAPSRVLLALRRALATAVLGVAVGAAPAAAVEPGAAPVDLEVAGVLPMSEGGASILVLREKGAKTLLPLLVPGPYGRELEARLNGHGAASGLLGRAIEALGARVLDVELTEAEETARSARVHLSQAGKELVLPARPSESIALALSARAPIRTTRRVLDEAGLTSEEVARAHERAGRDARRGLRL